MAEHRVYPIRDKFLMDVPHVTHTVESKAEADRLIASGAFTDNPRHPDRLPEPDATPEAPQEAGPSDSASKE